ncbi:MAG: fused MFS/spermidine synthase [Deltaproteobacteria bacterium]|nr:fused MFS/spermidine synthase [Deltaproteobacteria bacterium]
MSYELTTDRRADLSPPTRLPFLLFFVSGLCSLIYEVVWARLLVLVFGNTTLAASTILAAFMAGLSLGGYCWGKLADRKAKGLLTLFGWLEIGIGLFALLSPRLIEFVLPLEIRLVQSPGTNYFFLALGRAFLCFLILIVPTFLMGGALPVMGRHVIRAPEALGRSASILYGLYSLGAVLGAGLAGFFLIGRWGHNGSLLLAAALNLLTGCAALIADRSGTYATPGRPAGMPDPAVPGTELSPFAAGLVLGGIGISGFCALAYEVLWTRLLTLMVDNSVYSFTIILMAFLSGIALGSLALAAGLRRVKNPLVLFALLEMGIGILALFFPFAVRIRPVPGQLPYCLFLLQGVFLMVLLPSLLMGAALPLAAWIYQAREKRVGSNLGAVYAVNTLGAVLGALSAGFLLIPLLGFRISGILLPALNWALGAALVLAGAGGKRLRTGIALGAWALILPAFLFMPADLYRRIYARLEPQSDMIYYREGIAATSAVFRGPAGGKTLYMNGIPQVGTDPASLKTFKIMGALPCLLHEDPSRALIITFGAGITSGTVARFVPKMDCVELVREAGEIAGYFSEENSDVLDRKGVSLYINDARHHLLTGTGTYPVIVADATHPRGYDSWVLFTREFYRLVRKRMDPDGVFCQWVPFHGMTLGQYTAILGTFFEALPHTSLWVVDRSYSILLGTAGPLRIDFPRLCETIRRDEVRRDLAGVGLDNPFRLLSHFHMGEAQVREMLRGFTRPLTDNAPRHLFFPLRATAREQYSLWPERNYARLIPFQESILPYLAPMEGGRARAEVVAGRIDSIRATGY